jgi:uncharacterized protein YhaN
MRIERLDLTRYGRFSDYAIDFGARPESGPDFHVVYGLNEAGKSTAVAAILDLLFGVEERSAYGAAKGRASVPNWHAYSAMRIGARLDLNGSAVEVARLKRDKASLVDKDNLAFDEGLLRTELAGIDREAFRTMFSLDDESLEKGGEAILASRGNLGELLFSASAGLAALSGRLEGLRERAERFYKPRGKITELAEKKRALEELKAERERLDTAAATYSELIRRREEAEAAHAAAAKALAARRTRADAIRRLLSALPHLAALEEAERQSASLAELPTPPTGATEEIARLQAEAIRLTTQKDSIEATIGSLEHELERIGDDLDALAIAGRVDAWRDLRSRYDTAKDIPVRRNELAARRAVVADVLRRLGREGEAGPASLILTARTVGAIEELMASRSGVESKLATARETLEGARSALAEAIDAAPQTEVDAAAIERLKNRLAAVRRDEWTSRLRSARADAEATKRRLFEALEALKPWSGGLEMLAAVIVPSPAETTAIRDRLAELRARREGSADRVTQKAAEAGRLKAEASAAARAPNLVGDGEALALREARDSAWNAHRAALSAPTADAFEEAMRADDVTGAARLANARELAALRERVVSLAGVEADRARAEAELEAADRALNGLAHEIAALLPTAAPAGREPLGFLEGWRTKREEALALRDAHRAYEDAFRRVAEGYEQAQRALSTGLREAGVTHKAEDAIERLVEGAEAALAAAVKADGAWTKVKEKRTEAGRAEGRLKTAADADTRWRDDWRRACADTWLGEGPALPTVGAMRQTLKALDDLRMGVKDCAELEHRIGAMERDRGAFAEEVALVGEGLGLALDEDAGRLADSISARVAAARDARRRREERETALTAARGTRRAVGEALAINERLAAAMTGLFGVATLAEVAGKLKACERRDGLLEEVAREALTIAAAGVADSFDAARAALKASERAALEQELGDLDLRATADEAAHAERYAALAEATTALAAVGGDDAVARIEEKRQTILEEIKEGARRYLTLRAGVAAADQALKLYRDRHRGAMMERASKSFSEISRGAYRGLAAEPDGTNERLIALGAEGGSKSAEQLSRGARFQLYLALRVAGYHELAKARRPAPFVADDIMETFDHFRAEEALKLFADMGRVGQVIYLTHHWHLVEIAKKVCPETRVHQLK